MTQVTCRLTAKNRDQALRSVIEYGQPLPFPAIAVIVLYYIFILHCTVHLCGMLEAIWKLFISLETMLDTDR